LIVWVAAGVFAFSVPPVKVEAEGPFVDKAACETFLAKVNERAEVGTIAYGTKCVAVTMKLSGEPAVTKPAIPEPKPNALGDNGKRKL